MPTPTCPSPETLQRFLAGTLEQPLLAEARTHVITCAWCAAELDRKTDAQELRRWAAPARALPPLEAEEPALLRVLQALRAWSPEPPEADTPSEQGRMTAPAAGGEVLPFLGPPKGEGELGTLGPYRVQQELGRGGMGIVLRARDETLERTVALKVLRPGADTERARSRLIYEARLAAQLKHDHLVTVYAVVDPPGALPYLVMEYLDGPTLAALIHQRQRLAADEAADLVGQAAEGLATAHAAGLVHRDVKPGNIMLDTATGRAKVLDFGLARPAEQASGLTREGTVTGTPAYMSPEQIEDPAAVDARTDVYGLGVTLYEALTGEVPFRGTLQMVLRQVLEEEPGPPRRINETIPRDLETVCLKAMAREPQRRYATARELADDLARFRRGEPVQARAAGSAERLARWCRRNRRVALLSGAVLALLLLATVGSTVAAVWIAAAKAEADQGRADAEDARRSADASAQAARAAQEQADANARAANAHLQLAMDTLNTLVGKVQQQVGEHSGTIKLRKELLETARQGLEQIAGSAAKHPAADRSMVKVHERMGHLFFQLGQRPQAREQFEQFRRLAEVLLAEAPDDVRLQLDVAMAHDLLGNIDLYGGDRKAAEAHYQEALRRREAAARKAPEDEGVLRGLAGSCSRLGDVRLQEGDAGGAHKLYREAVDVLLSRRWATVGRGEVCYDLRYGHERLGLADFALRDYPASLGNYLKALNYAEAHVAADPSNVPAGWQLGLILFTIAEQHLSRGDYTAAAAAARQGIATVEPLVTANPEHADMPHDLADGYKVLGDVLRHGGDPAGARPWYEKALALSEKAASRQPGLVSRLRDVAGVCGGLDQAERQRGEYRLAANWIERALAACRRSEEAGLKTNDGVLNLRRRLEQDRTVCAAAQQGLLEDEGAILARPAPLAAALLSERARHLARLGRHAEATAAVERLRRLSPEGPRRTLDAGFLYAECAGDVGQSNARQGYMDRAVEALGQAARADWYLARRVRPVPALGPLYADARFQALLRELPRLDQPPPAEAASAKR